MVSIKHKNACVRLVDEVYDPAEDSFLLADAAIRCAKEGMRVLEVGVGSGFVSAVLKANVDVDLVATEINPYAASCAKSNGIDVIRTDMFSALKPNQLFDMILFNPPYLPTSDDEKIPGWLNYAFDGGRDGRTAVDRFLNEVNEYLAPEGQVLILISSLTGIDEIQEHMELKGFDTQIIARDKCSFEELVVLLGKRKA